MASKKGVGENVPAKVNPEAVNALAATAPIMVQLNPGGKWESKEPDSVDDQKLQEIIQHLISSRAISSQASCCSQCAAENLKCGKEGGGKTSGTNYVPIIMMPIYSTENSPFDYAYDSLHFEPIKKNLGATAGAKTPKNKATEKRNGLEGDDEGPQKKVKRAFVLQRLTNFDLLSQW